MTKYVLYCLKLVPLRGKNIFEPRLSIEILGGFLENFQRASNLYGSPRGQGGGCYI